MSHPTFVIGHKNPDADAICSAIAYADLKNRITDREHVPARCGNSNSRIDAILKRFQSPLPRFIGDVTPRLKDIMVPLEDVLKVKRCSTCSEALEIIDKHDVRAVPVVDDSGKVEGLLSIFQLGEYFIPKPAEPRKMRHVYTSISDIVRSLKAKVLNVVEPDTEQNLYVRVGAMDIRSFGRFAREENTPPEESIIVVGDRWDIQSKSISDRVRLLVITGNLEMDPEIVAAAQEKGVSLIVSPYDSATTSWVIRSAGHIERLVESEIVSFGADEKVASVKRRILNDYAPLYIVLDENKKLSGVFSKTDILKPSPVRLILVDHNELGQAVTGAGEVEIAEVLDHHKLGNPPTNQPILFVNEPVGSTCTIVANLYKLHNQQPDAQIAGIMMSGIISDTLNLRSPTTTKRDEEILAWLSEIAGVDHNELAEMIFSSGSVILSHEPEEIIRSDMKVYEENGLKYSVSQIEELGFANFWDNVDAIQKALAEVREKEGCQFSGLLVTDINTQNSLFVVEGKEDIISRISYPMVTRDQIFDMQGIVSRKKQLIPYLTTIIGG